MVTITKNADFISAVYNPITIELYNSGYVTGDLFFIELYSIPTTVYSAELTGKTGSTLLTTFTKNGDGSGKCLFDLSNVLSSLFTGYTYPFNNDVIQVDKSAYKAYYFKYGEITFDSGTNEQTKTYTDESNVKYVLRAAYKLNSSTLASQYNVNYVNENVKFLTAIPNGIDLKTNENTFLPLLLPLRTNYDRLLTLKANLYFKDGTQTLDSTVTTYPVTEGGVFIINTKPANISTNPLLSSFDVWVEYTDSPTETGSGEGGSGE